MIVTDNPQQAAPAANVIAIMRDCGVAPRGPTTGLSTDAEDERGTRDVGGNLG